MVKNYLIIGASAAGISAALKLRQFDQDAKIICFSEEKEFPYNKCFLADYLHGRKKATDILIRTPDFLASQNIILFFDTKIVKINPQNKFITDRNGLEYGYDKVLIATGGSIRQLPIKGIEQPHVLSFYTMKDADAIILAIKSLDVKSVVIIGAGLSGLECADAVSKYVESVTVVERAKHLLPCQVTFDGAQVIERALKNQRIELKINCSIQEIRASEVLLSNKEVLKADLVISACGATPNGSLAETAYLETTKGSLVTNKYLQTNNKDIYAAGDVAIVTDLLTGNFVKSCTWPDALIQGSVAASNMAGVEREYSGVIIITSSAFFGVKFFSAGTLNDCNGLYKVQMQKAEDSYRLIVHENGIIKGFLLIGNTHGIVELKQALLTKKRMNDL